ncbi:MAG: S8 family serine peptidase, partial [Spirillospora sp.]
AAITHEFTRLVHGVGIRLNGQSAEGLANAPGAVRVLPSIDYRPTQNESTKLINAQAFWNAVGGASNAGTGIRIGVLDTGIDQTHVFFDPPGGFRRFTGALCPDPISENDPAFTSRKVIVARVYNFPGEDFDASDQFGHGTHVAGSAAGFENTSDPSGRVAETLSGVAPRAWIGNYNVFPGTAGSATAEDIALAVEDAVCDGMQVLNLSLGGTASATPSVLELALESAAEAGVISAVAAGNTGPGAGTIESPGQSPRVLTAGASTNPHFLGQQISGAGAAMGAAVGDFDPLPDGFSAPYTLWADVDPRDPGACSNRPVRGNLSGRVAVIARGTCTFTFKIRKAESLGAAAVVIYNNVAGDPVAMGHDGTDPFPAIPAVMVSKDNGAVLVAAGSDNAISVTNPAVREVAGTADIIAGFSSRGPTVRGLQIKPDLTAPGVNVYSSVPGGQFAMFQGTSMATPHLAGAAALVRQHRPDWTVEQIKSAITNAAVRVVKDHVTGTSDVGVMVQGAGRLDLARTVTTPATFDRVSVSFGAVSGGATITETIAVTNVSGSAQTFNVTLDGHTSGDGVTVSVSPNLVLAPGATETIDLTVTTARRVTRGDYEGYVVFSQGGSEVLHAAYWLRVGR